MIKYFAVENFRSIKEENIVEFDTGLKKNSLFIAHPTIGIAGANASGKSSFLQALSFTIWFMQNSFLHQEEGEAIPIESFITCQKIPTKLHLIFSQLIVVDNQPKAVDCEYTLWLTREEVIKEELLYFPYNRKRIIYQRDYNQVKQGNTIVKLGKEIWKNIRKNASVVSFASQFNSQIVAQECKHYKVKSNLTEDGMYEYEFSPEMIKDLVTVNNVSKSRIAELLRIADTGIDDFEIEKDISREATEALKQIIVSRFDEIKEQKSPEKKITISYDEFKNVKVQDYNLIFFKHKIENLQKKFLFTSESSGTLKFLALVYSTLQALQSGEILILDEIEIKLHQNLVAYIIGLFQNKYENPHGAQLIFSFHNTYFMEILEPGQLWFTEKNDQGCTEIFSAADFKDIKKLQQRSLEELYRLGRFGAKPRGI